MNVRVAYTLNGAILGDFVYLDAEGEWLVRKPVIVSPQMNNIALVPLLGFCEETEIRLKPSDILYGDVFTPVPELRNHYSTQFGSGIQLLKG